MILLISSGFIDELFKAADVYQRIHMLHWWDEEEGRGAVGGYGGGSGARSYESGRGEEGWINRDGRTEEREGGSDV